MIVYVETNFILELALKQEQYSDCNELLKLAQKRKISLVLPSFSFIEPHETLIRRHKTRKDLHYRLKGEIRELARTDGYQNQEDVMKKTSDILIGSTIEESASLKYIVNNVIGISTVIDLTKEIIRSAVDYEMSYDFSPQDAVVYASIMTHLETTKPDLSCFLNRNSKDFNVPDIQEALNRLNCKIMPSFVEGLKYVKYCISET